MSCWASPTEFVRACWFKQVVALAGLCLSCFPFSQGETFVPSKTPILVREKIRRRPERSRKTDPCQPSPSPLSLETGFDVAFVNMSKSTKQHTKQGPGEEQVSKSAQSASKPFSRVSFLGGPTQNGGFPLGFHCGLPFIHLHLLQPP